MEEKEGFVKNSSIAIKGAFNGILGSMIYEIIIALIVSYMIVAFVSSNNPGVSGEEIEALIDSAYNTFPFSILISCLGSLVTLIVFVFIIKWDTFKNLVKKAININTLKYGVITALCIMGFSMIYNSLAITIFKLDGGGNANQETVIDLVKQNAVLGFLAVALLAPIVEELTYRYCMFGELAKKKKWVAYLVSGLIFMFMHSIASFSSAGGFNKELLMEMVYLPPYLFSGLALCYAYDKTGNIGSSFVAHFANNFISFLTIVCL